MKKNQPQQGKFYIVKLFTNKENVINYNFIFAKNRESAQEFAENMKKNMKEFFNEDDINISINTTFFGGMMEVNDFGGSNILENRDYFLLENFTI